MHLNLCTEVSEANIRDKLSEMIEWIKCARIPQARIIMTWGVQMPNSQGPKEKILPRIEPTTFAMMISLLAPKYK
jgi:predicted XRE-type DNA-binding protein